MIWVSISQRKPPIEGYYYWKGKSGYGGMAWYGMDNLPENEGNNNVGFHFDNSVPVNKVDEEYLYWLDETKTDEEFEKIHSQKLKI